MRVRGLSNLLVLQPVAPWAVRGWQPRRQGSPAFSLPLPCLAARRSRPLWLLNGMTKRYMESVYRQGDRRPRRVVTHTTITNSNSKKPTAKDTRQHRRPHTHAAQTSRAIISMGIRTLVNGRLDRRLVVGLQ